jgi:hypothetical protein
VLLRVRERKRERSCPKEPTFGLSQLLRNPRLSTATATRNNVPLRASLFGGTRAFASLAGRCKQPSSSRESVAAQPERVRELGLRIGRAGGCPATAKSKALSGAGKAIEHRSLSAQQQSKAFLQEKEPSIALSLESLTRGALSVATQPFRQDQEQSSLTEKQPEALDNSASEESKAFY